LIDTERQKRVITTLRERHLDAVICGSATEVLLLSGYWPVMGASIAIFTAQGELLVVLPEDEIELAGKSSQATLTPYKPADLARLITPVEAITDPLRSIILRLGLRRATIGIQVEPGMQPASYASCTDFRPALFKLMQSVMPDATYIACDQVLEQLKAQKTPTELEQLGKAAEIAATGFGIAANSVRVGRREAEVAADIQAAFQTCPKAAEAQRSYGFIFCMSGPNSACASAAYARTRQRKIEQGDLVMIHANTCADGYWTDITRTYTAGAPDQRKEAMRSAITKASKAALAAVRPGVSAREVDGAARRVMVAHGFGDAFKHSTGHGVGFAAVDANALPRIHPHSPDVLDVGMTFNIEPAAYFDGYGGMRHCDVVAVTRDGASVLTGF
jgi:Xaa-Pro aminopeptidase